MNYTHIQKNLGHSPRKMRLVSDMARGMEPRQAIEALNFVQKAAAIDLVKAIKAALANAGGAEGLTFKALEVNEGMKLKRYLSGTAGRGRGRPFKRRLCHIKIVLTDEVTEKKQALSVKRKAKSIEQKQETVEKKKGETSVERIG